MLQSHLHSLIAKAHRYQAEPERFERTSEEPLQVKVHGANGDHDVVLQNGHLYKLLGDVPNGGPQWADEGVDPGLIPLWIAPMQP